MAYHKIKCCPYLLYDHSVLAILTLVNMYLLNKIEAMLLMTINKFCFRASPQFGLRAADDTLILYKQFFYINFTKFIQ